MSVHRETADSDLLMNYDHFEYRHQSIQCLGDLFYSALQFAEP
jgi:hypothetical protein